MELSLTIIVCGLLLLILTKANDAYAEWIIPSQINEAYKNAQHYSNSCNNTSIPAVRIGQGHNSTTTAAISSSLCTISNTHQHR
jgi:hypothetical protein